MTRVKPPAPKRMPGDRSRYRVEVTARGFCLWDDFQGKWVIDASCLADDREIRISLRRASGITFIDQDASSPTCRVELKGGSK